MNDTQKNFKKQMKKGLKDFKRRNEDGYYKYVMQNHLDNPELRSKYERKEKIKNIFKKIFYIITTIIIICIIIPFAYNKLSNFSKTNDNIELSSSNSINIY